MKIELVTENSWPYGGKYLYRVVNNVFISLRLEFLNEKEAKDFVHKIKTDLRIICKEILDDLT